MRELIRAGALLALCALGLTVTACTAKSIDNGLNNVPQVHISESARIPLSSGAVGTTGVTLTDSASGAAVTIPAGTTLTLDTSASDDVPAVTPDSIVVVLRPISQYLAAQDGDLLTADGLTVPTKVGALALLPINLRSSSDISVTIPLVAGTTGQVTVWQFIPDDLVNSDGALNALPTVGHWRPLATATAASDKVTFTTTSFGQFLVTTFAGGGTQNQAPVAALDANPKTGDSPLAVTFDATGSTDSDGTIVSYSWDWDGDGRYEETDTSSATINHTYDTAGQFDPVVQVKDNQGATDTATVHISVGNAPPAIGDLNTAVATTNVETTYTVTSTDDGTIAKYEWDFDNSGTFTDTGTTASIAHTFTTTGPHTITVRVTDDKNVQSTKDFTITVSDAASQPATLAANPNPATLPQSGPVTVNFATTLNPVVTVTQAVYNFGDGSAPVTVTDTPLAATHDYTTAGTYHATVVVTPTTGDPLNAAVDVVVNTAGGAPTATVTADPSPAQLDNTGNASVDFTVALTGGATAQSAEYQWDTGGTFEAESDATPLAATHVYTTTGDHVVTVHVTPTGGGAVITGTTTVTVNPAAVPTNNPPTASFLQGPDPGNSLKINFDASASTDDGSIADYDWDFGDGSAHGFGVKPSHTYAAAGSYTVTLLVSDNGDPPLTDTQTTTVVVTQ